MKAGTAGVVVLVLGAAAFAGDEATPEIVSRAVEQAQLDGNHSAITQAATQPTDLAEHHTSIQQLRDDCQRLREKSALARAALESARAAALHRFSQTLDCLQAQAALANAQKELDDADSKDARTKAATDKINAKASIAHLQEKAINTDAAVTDAAKADAEISADLKLAAGWLVKAQANETASELAEKEETGRREKKVVLSAHEFNSLPKNPRNGREAGFTWWCMNSVGYITSAKVVSILDESTSIVEVHLIDETTGVPDGSLSPRQMLIEGMPTNGQADDGFWSLNCWFKIVDTRIELGTTYFVARQIVSVENIHNSPSAGK